MKLVQLNERIRGEKTAVWINPDKITHIKPIPNDSLSPTKIFIVGRENSIRVCETPDIVFEKCGMIVTS